MFTRFKMFWSFIGLSNLKNYGPMWDYSKLEIIERSDK